MIRRLWLAVALVVAAACVAEPQAQSEPDIQRRASPDPSVSSSDKTTTVMSPERVRLEVLAGLETSPARRLRQLGIFGYGLRPSTSSEWSELSDLGEQLPEAAVQLFDVNWGIESSAVLVVIDGDVDTIGLATERVVNTTPWLVSGDGWLVALYQGGLAAGFEIDELAEVIIWIMDPVTACDRSDKACPAGRDVGFPPPPPALVVNAPLLADPPFEVIEVPAASSIGTDATTLTWVDDGQIFTSWGDPRMQHEAEPQGPGTITSGFGSFLFVVAADGPAATAAVELRPCCDQAPTRAWSLPPPIGRSRVWRSRETSGMVTTS